ncbi:MAG: four helix bundle protein [Bacteroidota bacterium]
MEEGFNDFFRRKTKVFAIALIKYINKLPRNEITRVINYQLLKAGTSVGANFRAACRARSDAENYSKLCIVVEEADETLFWLEIIEESEIDNSPDLHYLKKEALEIVSIAAKARKNHSHHK